jgi:uncharacterized metal-binding protein
MGQASCVENKGIMILACSGASNLGQLSNRAAVELAREGFGKMSCLAGVGGHVDNYVHAAGNAGMLVAIDGCPVACAKKILEYAEAPLAAYVTVSELGFEKSMNTVLNLEDVEKVKEAVKDICNHCSTD